MLDFINPVLVKLIFLTRTQLTNFLLERFVYFSTDEVFGPAPHGVSYKEYDRYNSGNPYSAAKVAT